MGVRNYTKRDIWSKTSHVLELYGSNWKLRLLSSQVLSEGGVLPGNGRGQRHHQAARLKLWMWVWICAFPCSPNECLSASLTFAGLVVPPCHLSFAMSLSHVLLSVLFSWLSVTFVTTLYAHVFICFHVTGWGQAGHFTAWERVQGPLPHARAPWICPAFLTLIHTLSPLPATSHLVAIFLRADWICQALHRY